MRVVKARCRDVGQQLRRRYDCTDPADRNVQLTVETGTLVHSTNRTRERQELGDTDVVLSDDESAERAPSRIASVHSDDTTVGVDPSLASTDSEGILYPLMMKSDLYRGRQQCRLRAQSRACVPHGGRRVSMTPRSRQCFGLST